MNDMEKNLVSDSSEDFAAMLEETMIKFRPGQVVKGVVAQVSDDGVVVSIPGKADGYIKKNDLVTTDCKVDDESGVVGVSVTTQDPLVSMQIADSVVNHLQDFITRYRTSKACNDLVYYRGLEKEAAAKYELAKRKYAAYCDSHQDLALQSYRTEQESLENELQMAFTAYSQIRQQVQMAEAKVQEKTPAFTMLEDSSVPNAPVAPRKVLILFGCIFLGVLGTLGWIYVRLLFPPAAADGQTETARIKNEVKE